MSTFNKSQLLWKKLIGKRFGPGALSEAQSCALKKIPHGQILFEATLDIH